NCMGVINTDPAVSLDATFAPTFPPAGNVGMPSQSGALGVAVLDYARALDIGVSTFVSVGNKADVSGNDLLAYWKDDPRTQVVALYLESFGNPRRFARLAPEVARGQPRAIPPPWPASTWPWTPCSSRPESSARRRWRTSSTWCRSSRRSRCRRDRGSAS